MNSHHSNKKRASITSSVYHSGSDHGSTSKADTKGKNKKDKKAKEVKKEVGFTGFDTDSSSEEDSEILPPATNPSVSMNTS